MKRRVAMAAAGAMVFVLAACGGDGTTTTTSTLAATTTSTESPTTSSSLPPPPEPHPLDMTSQEICDTVPADEVAEVLQVTVDEAVPFEDGSPQCSYQFFLEDGSINNAIVNVPTINGDLGGATGDEAFDFVVGLYAGSNFTETADDVGDRSVVLSSPPDVDAGVHVGVIRIGDRIIVTIVSVGLVEYDRLLDLNELAVEYLTP